MRGSGLGRTGRTISVSYVASLLISLIRTPFSPKTFHLVEEDGARFRFLIGGFGLVEGLLDPDEFSFYFLGFRGAEGEGVFPKGQAAQPLRQAPLHHELPQDADPEHFFLAIKKGSPGLPKFPPQRPSKRAKGLRTQLRLPRENFHAQIFRIRSGNFLYELLQALKLLESFPILSADPLDAVAQFLPFPLYEAEVHVPLGHGHFELADIRKVGPAFGEGPDAKDEKGFKPGEGEAQPQGQRQRERREGGENKEGRKGQGHNHGGTGPRELVTPKLAEHP